ncbi:unnamed protein product [Xylocopa violacea]|uniref:Uncharacterized protein n=1 Tax=Xylocopa violacea TaxID=135666 RepID=A0ABP1PK19_XYLVO
MLSCGLSNCLDYKHVALKGKTCVSDVTKAGNRIRARLASSSAIIEIFGGFWYNSGESVRRIMLSCGLNNCLDYKHVALHGKTRVSDVTKAGNRIRARLATSSAIIEDFWGFWENSGESVRRIMLSYGLNNCLDYKHVALHGKTRVSDVTKAGNRIRARLSSSCAIIVGFWGFWDNSGESVRRIMLSCGLSNCLDYKHVALKGKTCVSDVTKAGNRIRARLASSSAIIEIFGGFWYNSGESVRRIMLSCGLNNCLDYKHVALHGKTRVSDVTKAGNRIRARLATSSAIIEDFWGFWENSGESVRRIMLSYGLNNCLDYKHVALHGKTRVSDVTKAGNRIRARLASSSAIIDGLWGSWYNSGESVRRIMLSCGLNNCLDYKHVALKGKT